jgi:hypothetical protein
MTLPNEVAGSVIESHDGAARFFLQIFALGD